jgi:hypothetical protein
VFINTAIFEKIDFMNLTTFKMLDGKEEFDFSYFTLNWLRLIHAILQVEPYFVLEIKNST